MVMEEAAVVTVTFAPAVMVIAAVKPFTLETRLPLTSLVVSVTAPVRPATLVTAGAV